MVLLESCLQTCMTYTIAECTVKNSWWWTEERSKTCRISCQNKFVKLVHLLEFIIKRLTSVEMKLFRTVQYTIFDHKGKKNFGRAESRASWQEAKKTQIIWLRHVSRMNNRMPKIILNYRPYVRLGRLLKKLLDEAATGLWRRNLWRMMIIHSSVSQPLWDCGPVNSFFTRRGPGPNKFTRKYRSIFLSSYVKLT